MSCPTLRSSGFIGLRISWFHSCVKRKELILGRVDIRVGNAEAPIVRLFYNGVGVNIPSAFPPPARGRCTPPDPDDPRSPSAAPR